MVRKDKKKNVAANENAGHPPFTENDTADMTANAAIEEDFNPQEECPNGQANQPIDGLVADLQKAIALQEEYLTLAQRVQADFDNFRKRNQQIRADAYQDGSIDTFKALLPVVDNLERALEAGQQSSDQGLFEGVQLVYKQLMEVFEKKNITPINRIGEKFDPNLENAMLQGTPEDGEPGTVCAVFQKGYQMNDTVLRYAMVQVVPE